MVAQLHTRKVMFGVLALVVLVAAVLVAIAPDEKTLGDGIKVVYVHVALTWTGMTGIVILSLLGLGVLLTGRPSLQDWAQKVGWVALVMFACGFLMSMLAAHIDWGAVFWTEPRLKFGANVIALTLIVQILGGWLTSIRLRGLLAIVPAVFMTYSVLTTQLVLHPQSPILTSDSRAIQFTFFGLFALFFFGALWSVWQWRRGALKSAPAQ